MVKRPVFFFGLILLVSVAWPQSSPVFQPSELTVELINQPVYSGQELSIKFSGNSALDWFGWSWEAGTTQIFGGLGSPWQPAKVIAPVTMVPKIFYLKAQVLSGRLNSGQSFPVLVLPAKVMLVDLSRQRYFCYEGGQLVKSGLVSTGKIGRETAPGFYHVQTKWEKVKYVDTEKKVWCWMTNWQSFTKDRRNGMHSLSGGGSVYGGYEAYLGRRVSHGCIRLSRVDAIWLFGWTELKMPLIVAPALPTFDQLSVLSDPNLKWDS